MLGVLTPFQPDIWQCRRMNIGPNTGGSSKRWRWKQLRHPYWRIYWARGTGARVSFDGNDYALAPESVVVVAPGTPVDHHHDRPFTHVYIHATLGYPYDRVVPRVDCVPADKLPVHLLDTALAGDGNVPPRDPLNFRQTLAVYAFVCELLRALPEEIWPPPAPDPAIRGLAEYIARNPERRHRSSTMAQRLGISVDTLARRFRDQIGLAPHQFVIEQRLHRACLLLDQTTQSIEQIADACGFCDRYHLSKVFKSHFRSGPATYRRNHSPG